MGSDRPPGDDLEALRHEVQAVAQPLLEQFADRPVIVVVDAVIEARRSLIDLTGTEPEPNALLVEARRRLQPH